MSQVLDRVRRFLTFMLILLAPLAMTGQDVSSARTSCPNTLFAPTTLSDKPSAVWDGDTRYVPGTNEDGAGNLASYVLGDKLELEKDALPSLFRLRKFPNTKVSQSVFDAREIDLNMSLVFDSAKIVFYAHLLRIGAKGAIVFTEAPKDIDGITIIADTIDLSTSPLHPFVFVTSDDGNEKWPAANRRLVTLVANHIIRGSNPNLAGDGANLVSRLTLDEHYGVFVPQDKDKLAAYTVEIGTEKAARDIETYTSSKMLWPLETAEKVARQFSQAPFDQQNTDFLKAKAQEIYTLIPSGSNRLARQILAQTVESINLRVDNFGLYANYTPRLLFPSVEADFKAQKDKLFESIKDWDEELISAQEGRDRAKTSVLEGVDRDLSAANKEIAADREEIDRAVNDLAGYESQIAGLMGRVQQYQRDDEAARKEDEKKRESGYQAKIVGKIVIFAASLIPVSAPVAIAIGTGAGIMSNRVADFQEGKAPSLGNSIRDIPGVVQEAAEFNKKANELAKQWVEVKKGFNEAQAKPEIGKDEKDKTKTDNGERSAAVSEFVTQLADVVSSLNVPQPTQLTQDSYDQGNAELQNTLHQIADIREQEGQTTATLKSLQERLSNHQTEAGKLNELRKDLSAIDIKDDRGRAERESIAWFARQENYRQLVYQSVVLLRSYKYHTLKSPRGAFNEQYLESQYRLSGPIEQTRDLAPSTPDGSDAVSFFHSPGRKNLERRLVEQRTNLQHDIEGLLTNLDSGFIEFKNQYILRKPSSVDHSFLCTNLSNPIRQNPRDRNCEFIHAVNDELDWQIRHPSADRYQAEIPIPMVIAREHNQTPSTLVDISVSIEYENPRYAQGVSIKFIVEHPMFGQLWGAGNNDCTLVDMRSAGAVINMQPYPSTCNEAKGCDQTHVSLPKIFEDQNQEHAPLPLDTIYFLKPIVESFDPLRSAPNPPRITAMHVLVSSVN